MINCKASDVDSSQRLFKQAIRSRSRRYPFWPWISEGQGSCGWEKHLKRNGEGARLEEEHISGSVIHSRGIGPEWAHLSGTIHCPLWMKQRIHTDYLCEWDVNGWSQTVEGFAQWHAGKCLNNWVSKQNQTLIYNVCQFQATNVSLNSELGRIGHSWLLLASMSQLQPQTGFVCTLEIYRLSSLSPCPNYDDFLCPRSPRNRL